MLQTFGGVASGAEQKTCRLVEPLSDLPDPAQTGTARRPSRVEEGSVRLLSLTGDPFIPRSLHVMCVMNHHDIGDTRDVFARLFLIPTWS